MPDVHVDVDVSIDESMLADSVADEIATFLSDNVDAETQVNEQIVEVLGEYDFPALIKTNINANLYDEVQRLVSGEMDGYHETLLSQQRCIDAMATTIAEQADALIKLRSSHNDWALLLSKLSFQVDKLNEDINDNKRSWWSKLWS